MNKSTEHSIYCSTYWKLLSKYKKKITVVDWTKQNQIKLTEYTLIFNQINGIKINVFEFDYYFDWCFSASFALKTLWWCSERRPTDKSLVFFLITFKNLCTSVWEFKWRSAITVIITFDRRNHDTVRHTIVRIVLSSYFN